MSRTGALGALLGLALVAAVVRGEEGIEVAIVRPDPGTPVFGEVEIEVEVYPFDLDVSRVEIFIDGFTVAILEEPPWVAVADAGEQNESHEILAVVHARSGASGSAVLTTPRFETDLEYDVELQQLYVTAERGGEAVLDLEREELTIVEDGRPQETVTFERGDVPFTAVILVDASTSMQGARLRTALQAAKAFIRGMQPLDEAKLLLFSDRVVHETPFTSFATVLELGLAGVEADGGTAVNDHLYLALKRLERRQGRKVVILLSDGFDIESALSMTQVQPIAQSSQAALYWIRLGGSAGYGRLSVWRDEASHGAELARLEETVTTSGGRILPVATIAAAAGALQEVLDELRSQYVLGYYPDRSDAVDGARWHEVEVRLDRGGVAVRTRGGRLRRDLAPELLVGP